MGLNAPAEKKDAVRTLATFDEEALEALAEISNDENNLPVVRNLARKKIREIKSKADN